MKTVNFIEAVNSGKRFLPEDYGKCEFWFTVSKGKTRLGRSHDPCIVVQYDNGDQEIAEIYPELVNKRFVLEEKSITITESEFDDISRKVVMRLAEFDILLIPALKKELFK
jgi:hypothetical protein